MKLKGVQIENFMAIGHASLELADRGLVLVQGENPDESSSDSNGAGKSSIFDAVSWCLYGTTARGEEGDKIVNRTAGKDCMVRIGIVDGADSYVIERFRKHKKNKNLLRVVKYDTAGVVDLSKGTEKLTQEVVNQIVGCSYEVFCGAVYAGQERMPDLPGMTDKQLKMLIEEASGATVLEAAYGEANKRLVAVEKQSFAAAEQLEHSEEMLQNAKERLGEAIERREHFETIRVNAVKDWHAKGLNVRDNIRAAEAKLVAMGDKTAIEKKIAELDAKIVAVDTEIEKDRKNSANAAAEGRAHATAAAAARSAEHILHRCREKLAELDHQVGCPCETCDRPFSAADIAPAKKLAATEVSKAECALGDAQAVADTALRRAQAAADARDAFRASMTDLTETTRQRASLQAQLRNISLQESAIAGLKSDLNLLKRQMVAKRAELNPYVNDIVNAEAAVTKLTTAVADAHAKHVAAAGQIQIHHTVAKVFSPAGLRAFLLDEVTPFLNDQTAKYLGTLSDGHINATWTTLVRTAKGELREKFSIEVDNATGGASFGLISGGEKRKVRIACALALQDLVARRASKPIELFIGDEIDDALDDAGRQRLMDVLEEKARERGSVFIISHSDLKDWVRNQITVRKSGGQATIEEVMV